MIQTISCSVHFVAPAFLGDADQKGTWRTPPFKALLRQWWRIAVAGQLGYDYTRLRDKEGKLFGHAWLTGREGKTWAMQGRVRLKLDRWDSGTLSAWPKDLEVYHPEVNRSKIGSHLYLGFGPLEFNKVTRVTALKNKPAINAITECSKITLAFPEKETETILQVLQLINWFGSVGGRSRNGWGSLTLLAPEEGKILPSDDFLEGRYLDKIGAQIRLLDQCMQLDWPHAFGRSADGKPLFWKTREEYQEWPEAMQELARVKIAFRTGCSIAENKDWQNPTFEERHLLSYPVTNHGVAGWVKKKKDNRDNKDERENFETDRRGKLKQEDRLANQLRFKLLRANSGKFVGIAYHLPHGLPKQLKKKLDDSRINKHKANLEWQLSVWRKVHAILDREMTRIERAPQ